MTRMILSDAKGLTKKAMLRLLEMVQNHRFALWIVLMLLTVTILFFPVHLSYNNYSVQSLYIFDGKLSIFGGLYYLWLSLLVLLLFTLGHDRKSFWEGLALAVIFGMVFLGFWSIIAPVRSDDGLLATNSVNYISTQGTFLANEHIFYSDFPGIHILASSIHLVIGLNIIDSEAVVLVLISMLFSALLYCLFSKTLKKPYIAAFAVLLVINGNWYLSHTSFFYPGYLGLIFLTAFLVLMNRKEGLLLGTWQDKLVMVILLSAATMTHFVTSVLFSLILLGVILVQLVGRPRLAGEEVVMHKSRNVASWSTVALCLFIPVVWEISQAAATFSGLVEFLPKMIRDLTEGQLFGSVFLLGGANYGEAIPLWANMIRLFWLVFIIGFGAILAFVKLIRLRKLTSAEKKEIGGLAGVLLLAAIATILSPSGPEGLRFLMYAPVFLVPITLRFLSRPKLGLEDSQAFPKSDQKSIGLSGRRFGGYVLIILILFSALSFPTFLVHNNMISTEAFYTYDFAPGKFLTSTYGIGTGFTIFFYGGTAGGVGYYLYDANHGPVIVDIKNKTDFWQQAGNSVTVFENWQGQAVFAFSQRGIGAYQHLFDIKSADTHWQQLELRLQSGNKIYSDSYVQLYEPG